MAPKGLSKLCMDDEDPEFIEEVRCNHGYVLQLMTSWTARNPGRRYWVCPYYGSARSCDYWQWKDGEIDPRSKHIIPKLLEKIGELESKLEYKFEKPRQTPSDESQVDKMNKLIVQLDYMKTEIEKVKEKEKKWKNKFIKSRLRENSLWLICLICVSVVVFSSRFPVKMFNGNAMKLP